MKASPGPSAPLTGTTINAIQLSYPARSPATLIFKQQPNNRRSTSLSYRTVDNNVVYNDAVYHTLSPTDQAQWDASATTSFAGFTLCGCKDSAVDGQNLHRATNLFRQMLGLPPATLPPSGGMAATQSVTDVQLYPDIGQPSGFALQISCGLVTGAQWVVFNTGLGFNNPRFLIPTMTAPFIIDAGDPTAVKLITTNPGPIVSWCVFDTNGFPGQSNTAPFLRF